MTDIRTQLITPLTPRDERPLPSPPINPKETHISTNVISEVLRVKQQYPNMSFYRFICFAAGRVGHCEDDHQLLLGLQMLDKQGNRADVQGTSGERSEQEVNR